MKKGGIDSNKILEFLKEMDVLFNPPLSERVSLESFARKLADNAKLFYRCDTNGKILALIALYANDFEKKYAYITFVGTSSEAQGQGLCETLLEESISYTKSLAPNIRTLGIHSNNPKAIHIYNKYGFKEIEDVNGRKYMELNF